MHFAPGFRVPLVGDYQLTETKKVSIPVIR
jgi:hypothetical protein